MSFYMLPVTEVREGDTVELSARGRAGQPSVFRVQVSATRRVGDEVWIYTPKLRYPGGQPMPLYFGTDISVGVERDDR